MATLLRNILKPPVILIAFYCHVTLASFSSVFQWKPSPWTECNQRDHQSSASCCQCYRSRTVSCILKSNQHQIPLYYCQKLLTDIKKPGETELCSPCHQDCVVSAWEDWSPCSQTCSPALRHRTRMLLLEATGDGRPCGPLVDVEECTELPGCGFYDPRPQYDWQVGDWTSCRRVSNETACGFGKRLRKVECVGADSLPVPHAFCTYHIKGYVDDTTPPAHEEDCLLPCDCQVGTWSSWGPCSQTCSKGSRDMSGYQLRSRNILHGSVRGGMSCPPLNERRTCDSSLLPSCPRYVWRLGIWRECQMDDPTEFPACGSGVQTRTVYCTQEGDPQQQQVEDLLCVQDSWFHNNTNGVMKPAEKRACEVLCPSDCELGEWQFWSSCSQSCGRNGIRHRLRPVLSQPMGSGRSCGITSETKPCEPKPCTRWHIGDWGRCYPNSANSRCGDGSKTRAVYCEPAVGTYLPDFNCSMLAPRPIVSMPCTVPCPGQCDVTDWSPWGPCSVSCGTDGGVMTRNRTIISQTRSEPCLPVSELVQTMMCNRQPCVEYAWQVAAWSVCIPAGNSTDGVCDARSGSQTRDVFCKSSRDERMADTFCSHRSLPISHRDCTPPCPSDCVMAQWTEWSACSHDCGTNSVKVRSRRILRLSLHGGAPCSARADSNGIVVLEKRCKNLPPCEVLTWFADEWGECQPNAECGYGTQRRRVGCNSTVNPNEEHRAADCLAAGLVDPPMAERTCFIPCRGDCLLSQWSEFSACNKSCGTQPGVRVRTRHLLHEDALLSVEDVCPQLPSNALISTEECTVQPCHTYGWEVGRWGTCSPTADENGSRTPDCGSGLMRRHVFCLRSDGTHVPEQNCNSHGDMPPRHQSCHVTCARDCRVTAWSSWSRCTQICGNGTKAREREVTEVSSHGGRPCPHLEEVVHCERRPCEMLEWDVGEWADCEPPFGLPCGSGQLRRSVSCPAGARYHSLCELYTPRPPASIACDKPCSEDCITSQWSSFSPCMCGNDRPKRYRSREIIHHPVATGKQCGPLSDSEDCVCWTYTLSLGNWTSCIPDGGVALCGLGVKRRHLECLREDGVPVSLDRCIFEPGLNFNLFNMSLEEPCEVVCPRDCQLSPFTSWSSCDAACGVRAMKARKRDVIMPPNEIGRMCPNESGLMQVVPCSSAPCYTYNWERSPWSQCSVPFGVCGEGERNRTVQCVRSDGTLMFDNHCLLSNEIDLSDPERKRLDLHTVEACGMPCPGDCQMSEWTAYGPCFKTCTRGGSHGIQYRSRGVKVPPSGGRKCPTTTVESRECDEDSADCPIFQWHAGNWGGNGRRKVHCIMSNGDKVDGGCVYHLKPPNLQRCFEDCSRYAACQDGACSCLDGFTGDGLTCLPVSGCVTDDNCVMNNTYCDTLNNQCLCTGGTNPAQDMTCGSIGGIADSWDSENGLDPLVIYIVIGCVCFLLLFGLVLAFLIVRRRRRRQEQDAPNLRKVDSLEAMQMTKPSQQNIANHQLADSTYIPADPGLTKLETSNNFYASNLSGFSGLGCKNVDDVISASSSCASPRKFSKPPPEIDLGEDLYTDSPEGTKCRRSNLTPRDRIQKSPGPQIGSNKDWVPHYEGPSGFGPSLSVSTSGYPKSTSPADNHIVRVPSARSVKNDGGPDVFKLSTFKPPYEDDLESPFYPAPESQPYNPNTHHTYHLQHPGTISPSLSSTTLPRNYQPRALPAIPTSFSGVHPPPAFVPTTLPSTYTSNTLPSPRSSKRISLSHLQTPNGQESSDDASHKPRPLSQSSSSAASTPNQNPGPSFGGKSRAPQSVSERVRCKTPTSPASELLMYCDELLADLEQVAST